MGKEAKLLAALSAANSGKVKLESMLVRSADCENQFKEPPSQGLEFCR